MTFGSRHFLFPAALLFVARVFAAPTEPLVDRDHFRYLEREELGPFSQDLDPKLSSGGAQFRSKVGAVLRRAVSSVPDNSDAGGLSTGLIVLIVFASVFGAVVFLGCASLVLMRQARRSAKIGSSTFKVLTPSSPTVSMRTPMISPAGTMDGRTLLQVLADAGLPVPRHPLSDKKQEMEVQVEKPSSPVRALLRSPFGFRAGASRRSSTTSHVLVIDEKSAAAAGATFMEERPRVPPVLAVPRLVSSNMTDGAKHDDDRRMSAYHAATPIGVPHTTAPTMPMLSYPPSRQQTMQSINSNVSDDSIPPCPPASPSVDASPAHILLSSHHNAPCSFTEEPTTIDHITSKPATVAPSRTLRVVNPKPKLSSRTNSNPLARTVVQRNMLQLAHSSRTHATGEPAQHPFAVSGFDPNGLGMHAPRPETLLRPPALRVKTTGLPGQSL